jgi:hypothetical protein
MAMVTDLETLGVDPALLKEVVRVHRTLEQEMVQRVEGTLRGAFDRVGHWVREAAHPAKGDRHHGADGRLQGESLS